MKWIGISMLLILTLFSCATKMTDQSISDSDKAVAELKRIDNNELYLTHQILGSDGNYYLISKGKNEPRIQREIYVEFGTKALVECGTPYAYVYNEWDEPYLVFQLNGTKWDRILQRKYAKDFTGRNIGALLPFNDIKKMKAKEIVKQVLELNRKSKSTLLENRSIRNYLFINKLYEGTAAYDDEIKKIQNGLEKQISEME